MAARTASLAFTTLLLALAGCTSLHQERLAPQDVADCRVGGEQGPPLPGATSSRERRCNPGQDAVLWSSEERGDMKLDLPRRDR